MSSTPNTTSTKPAFSRSKAMPAFRRALSMPSVEKSLASVRASSSRGLRRMSSFGKTPRPSLTITSFASASTESIPVFTTPDYTQPAAPLPPSDNVSPLTRPGFKRARTMPAQIRAMRSTALAALPALKKAVCERPSRKSSVASVESIASTSTVSTTSTRRRRSSSVASVESFSSSEDHVTIGLRLRAFPMMIMGLFTSVFSVILILLLPAMAAPLPKRKPAPRPYEREIILTEEQELNPPTLPKSTLSSRVSRAYLRRAARARRATTPTEAVAALFYPTPKRPRAATPRPVNPKTLESPIPLVVYSSPILLPLPKGPAPAVRPARKVRRLSMLPTVHEEEADAALCPSW
ncbi:hypothetical protein C8R43DRAFT_1127409 [Mycena crocata]|nr:hypothetical protein C8R43DRAFT_1127409 [Mycena crocata]